MSFISTAFRPFARHRNKSKRHVAWRRRLAVEPLERRAMLSVAPTPLDGTNYYQISAGLTAAPQHAIASAITHNQLAYSATEAKLTASDGVSGDAFGNAVAISGNTVVVGAALADNGQGAAYVFTRSGSDWADMTQVAELTASDGAAGDDFGSSVSISGNTVVVGEGNATIGANSQQGAAYVFTESASGWANMTQTAKLTASTGQANDEFGVSVSIDGSTLVVGADNPYSINPQGAAYVFARAASGWAGATQAATLTASDGTANDFFGSSVSISGNTVVVGAENATVGGNSQQGAAYVFTEPASGWANMMQTGKLTASDGAVYDYFGSSVAISGNTIVVGADNARVGGNSQQGAAYVFTEPASGWLNMTQTAKLTASDGAAYDYFGNSVSISGNTIVVGADNATIGANSQQGAAYVFTEPASGWANMTQTGKLTASDGAAGDFFGASVSISGNTIVVGATQLGESSGGGGTTGGGDSGSGGGDSGSGGGDSGGGGGDTTGGTGDTTGGSGDTTGGGCDSGGDGGCDTGGDSGDSGDDGSGDTGGDSGGDTGGGDDSGGDTGGDSGDSGDGGDDGDDAADCAVAFAGDTAEVRAIAANASASAGNNHGAAYVYTPVVPAWSIIGSGDFNGDGKADVLSENSNTGQVGAWITGSTDVSWLNLGTAPLNAGWRIAGMGNFNGDGKSDVLWENQNTGVVGAWVTGSTSVSWMNLGVAPLNAGWTIAGVGDFNGNGKSDVLWENQNTGVVGAWLTGSTGVSWMNVGVAPLNAGWTIAGVGDFNGDGKADVLWENQNTGVVGAWLTGSTGVSWMNVGVAPLNAGWTIAGVGDVSGDGKSDVLWENQNTGVVGAWVTGSTSVSWMNLGVAPLNAGWTIAGVGDFNGGGKADLLWENQDTGVVGAWLTGGGWLGLGVI